MASRQTRIRQQNANEALCQPVSGDASVDLRSYFAAASVVLLSGCAADYLNNYDTMTLASGDANNANSLMQMVDPFNPNNNNTHIEGDGQRSAAVVQRYRGTPLVGAAQQGGGSTRDLDCLDGSGNNPVVAGPVPVRSDPNHLDRDHDGIGCER
ncbi:calcium-binding protein [Mesorhizobium atlanticum]|uniref:Calcium-binding protein n=1 Tax=Mesorhizobium atlanticum TaxID=2233532 RepID=A0A330GNL9_9HYPH|nr:calcium-binding protein [Mesorhizobium atlanticum]